MLQKMNTENGLYAETTTNMCASFAVITNPEDPKFDLEKYLDKVSKENP